MSYIGNEPTTVAFLTDTFSGDGSTVAFTMSVAPATTSSILVAITGVVQDPSTYSVVGTTLTFSAAPPSGTGNISVRYLGIPASGVTTTAYRTVTDFTATAGQTTFSVPSYTVGYIDVYRNGVRLAAADYTATNGTTVVLASGATAGDSVVTESFYVSSVLNAIPATAGAVNSTYLADGSVTTAKILDANVTTAKLASTTGTGAVALASLPTFTTTIGVGGATPSASGSGITFPASQSASSNANTLDDYEEGTWTVVDTSGAGLSISSYMAQYVKIGRFVMAQFDINYPGTSNTNSAQFSLPFASNNAYSSGYFGYTTFAVGTTQYGPGMIVNDSSVNARVMSGGGQLTNAVCSGTRLMGTVCYYTT